MPTIQDIATKAGVSVTTVSDVLNGRHRGVRRDARTRAQRIRTIAQDIGYRPNAAARATRSGRFGAITLLLSTGYSRSSVPTDLFDAILQKLSERELNLMVVRLPDDRLTDQEFVPRILRETQSDGLLIDYTHAIPQSLINLIEAHKIPAVWVNSKQLHNCVRPDDFEASQRATHHLIDLGHRRIAYADFSHGQGYPTPHYSAADREAGYRDFMKAAGLTPQVIRAEGFEVASTIRYTFARQWLDSGDRPTAVIGYGQTTTNPIFLAAVRLGLNVPGDLSLVSFGDSPPLIMDQTLTTLVVPQVEIGHRALGVLLDRIENPQGHHPEVRVPFTFEPGTTSAPAVS